MLNHRLRVLFIASHPVQYQAPVFRRLAIRPEVEMRVAYCSLRGAEAALDPEFGTIVKWDVPLLSGYNWSHVPNKGSGSDSFIGLFNPGIWKIIAKGNYDAVVCFTGYVRATFWIAWLASKCQRIAFLFGADATSLEPRDGRTWKRKIKEVLWPNLFRLADQVIVPSTGTMELMLSLGVPRARITLTPYTVDNDWWMEQSRNVDRVAVRKSWGASPNAFVVLFSAKLQPWKRPTDLLRAFAKVSTSNALLVFAGDGPLKQQLQSEAYSLGIENRVRMLGFVNQSYLPSVYTSADVMVLPSEYEPFGVAVNEAMCCGCPVLVSDRVGARKDLIAPIRSDFVFRCGDIEALASILRRLASDSTLTTSIGRSCQEHMRKWSPEHNISATLEAIRFAADRVNLRNRGLRWSRARGGSD